MKRHTISFRLILSIFIAATACGMFLFLTCSCFSAGFDENKILYTSSTASQVIAAVFGLIITGYIFFRNELDRKASEDESFVEIIEYLKNYYFILVMVLSFLTIISIFFCMMTICLKDIINCTLFIFVMNVSGVSTILQLVLVVLFVLEILDPKSFDKASSKIIKMNSINASGKKGDLKKFNQYYSEIENLLDKYAFKIYFNRQTDPSESAAKYASYEQKVPTKAKIVSLLCKEQIISEELKNRLIRLISYRNGVIHSSDSSITIEDEKEAEQVLIALKKIFAEIL